MTKVEVLENKLNIIIGLANDLKQEISKMKVEEDKKD